jgi:hypothetical protein
MAASLAAGQIRLPPKLPQATSTFDGVPRASAIEQISGPAQSLWEKRWWIDKTAKLLRAGEGIGPDDDMEALLQMSEEEVARHFMNDPRFGDAVLDFNMYFMGFKADDIKTDGAYNSHAFDFANAISASQALLSDGDYFKLFDLEGSLFMAPLRAEPAEEDMLPGDAGLTATQLRRKAVGELQAIFNELGALAKAQLSTDGQELCRRLTSFAGQRDRLTERVHRAFDDAEIFILTRAQIVSWPLDSVAKAAREECARSKPQANVKRLAAVIQTASEKYAKAFEEMFRFEPEIYEPESVLEFKAFNPAALPANDKWLVFGYEQAVALQNSSTNFNRKRSAYVLKRFFCDDLTPVGFEDPQEHVAGAHGSDTSCFACHYKLDPMAGFFRNLGSQFYDYTRERTIIFDDLADDSRSRYEATWRGRKGSTRKWNVGYVRSPRWENQNSYGDTLTDLSGIIRQAPEPKRCLMKRLFEYMTAESQTIDGGYLDYLTEAFEAEAAVSSSAAMKNAIVRVLMSKTYHERNAEPQRCYDHAPDAKPAKGPPCRVAFILQKNCAQCHGTIYGGDASLDLGAWIMAPDGKNRTFPHLDDAMQQRPAQDTIARIMERLASTDPKRRMPKNKIMSSQERQELYLWAQQELSRIGKEDVQ